MRLLMGLRVKLGIVPSFHFPVSRASFIIPLFPVSCARPPFPVLVTSDFENSY